MKYKITIERKEPNPNFEAEYEGWKEEQRYAMSRNLGNNTPEREKITDALICELTEEQFKAIKAEVFKVFE